MRIAALAVVTLLVLGVVTATRARQADDPLTTARRLAGDDRQFETATATGVAFTRISSALEAAAESCGTGARCDALYAGAGWARVSAVGVLRCTRPGIFDARARLRRYVARLESDAPPPTPPPPVTCR